MEVEEVNDHFLFVPYTGKKEMGELNALLNKNDYTVYSIGKQQKDLEKLFLSITQNA